MAGWGLRSGETTSLALYGQRRSEWEGGRTTRLRRLQRALGEDPALQPTPQERSLRTCGKDWAVNEKTQPADGSENDGEQQQQQKIGQSLSRIPGHSPSSPAPLIFPPPVRSPQVHIYSRRLFFRDVY